MKILHDCLITRPTFPSGVNRIERTVRCGVCGFYWAMTWYRSGGSQAEPYPWRGSWKNWRWQRRMRKEMRK